MNLIKNSYGKNYYENIFYKEIQKSQRNRNRITNLLKYKTKGKLLEIGCGEGYFLKEAEKYFEVKGIEISEYASEKAKNVFGDKIRRVNIEHIDLQPDYYDAIVVFNLLEHLPKPEQILKKLNNALMHNGILIGSVPNNYGLIGGTTTFFSNIIDKTHCSTYSPELWREHFKETGFNDIAFYGEVQFGRNFSLYVKNGFWKYISFNLMFVCIKLPKY